MRPWSLNVEIERWPLVTPFRIMGYSFDQAESLVVTLRADGHVGRGEAAGIYYKNDKPVLMLAQVEALRHVIEAGVTRNSLQRLLPPGGARNALDCALWDLEAKLMRRPVWSLAGLESPRPLLTTLGCGADTPQNMATVARSYKNARAIKLKLTGESIDAERVQAVREALPEVWLAVDANQGFDRAFLERLMPVLVDAGVALIEQPLPVGQEKLLDGFDSPIPLAADESVQTTRDIPGLVGLFRMINIKLDKCGGLTEALAMARLSRELGLQTMVGNMIGTSLAMAPACLVGQFCEVVDLDGPVFLKSDRPHPVRYDDGFVSCPDALWGAASDAANAGE